MVNPLAVTCLDAQLAALRSRDRSQLTDDEREKLDQQIMEAEFSLAEQLMGDYFPLVHPHDVCRYVANRIIGRAEA